jgi:TetR/AcrR family transcriptional regulator
MDAKLSRRERERQKRKEEMIEAAERIFFTKGYDAASMDEIAKAAQFTKRTIYQYFSSKEDLYFAVACKWFRRLLAGFEEALAKGENGYEKFRLSGLAYYQFFTDFPAAFRVLNYCNVIKTNKDTSAYFQQLMQLNNMMFEKFVGAIEEGKRDGSIRADLDPKLGAYAGVYLSIGFLNIVSEKMEKIKEYHHVEMEDIIRYGLDLISSAFRGK